jgi:hypothetical protein
VPRICQIPNVRINFDPFSPEYEENDSMSDTPVESGNFVGLESDLARAVKLHCDPRGSKLSVACATSATSKTLREITRCIVIFLGKGF